MTKSINQSDLDALVEKLIGEAIEKRYLDYVLHGSGYVAPEGITEILNPGSNYWSVKK